MCIFFASFYAAVEKPIFLDKERSLDAWSESFHKTNIFVVDYVYFSESEKVLCKEFGALWSEKLVI